MDGHRPKIDLGDPVGGGDEIKVKIEKITAKGEGFVQKDSTNPFDHSGILRQEIISSIKLTPQIRYNGKGFICALITSRCPVGCEDCMFFSNMAESKNSYNTMTSQRISNLMKLVQDSNTGYLLVGGGGEGFLEPSLMYRIIEETKADVTWMVTSAFWAKDKDAAGKVLQSMHDAFLRGKHKEYGRKIVCRVSFDKFHVSALALPKQNPLQYIVNIIKLFEEHYSHEVGFVLMLHGLQGEETLVDRLCKEINGEKVVRDLPSDGDVKVTESAITIKLKSGYAFEVTSAKLLLSDLAPDLRNKAELKRKITIWEQDAFCNERGNPAVNYNPDGTIGTDMLVAYDGRIAGGWQSEMPDVPINVDLDDFTSIMKKTLSDPGVLGTIENGLVYRFNIIDEVCPKAVLRAKAVNVRDYTSPILLEEDKIKLYYSIRALQDFIAHSGVNKEEMTRWSAELKSLVSLKKNELQTLYHDSKYDIVQQFIEQEEYFAEFVPVVKQYTQKHDPQAFLDFFRSRPSISKRTIDKWRLLLKRIVNCWYDIYSFNKLELKAIEEVERILDDKVLGGTRIYEGLTYR